jgi:tetratricopeptide (TPR) repeat protein
MGVEHQLIRAHELYKKGDYNQAALIYSEFIELDSKNLEALEKRSMSYFHLKLYEKSLNDMNALRDLEPNNPYRYSSRAFLKSAMNKIDEAIEDYKTAVHLDPEDAVAYNNLGLLLEKKGYQVQAQNSFVRADALTGLNPQEKELTQEPKLTIIKVFMDVFTSSKTWNEFKTFVSNGFKLKS